MRGGVEEGEGVVEGRKQERGKEKRNKTTGGSRAQPPASPDSVFILLLPSLFPETLFSFPPQERLFIPPVSFWQALGHIGVREENTGVREILRSFFGLWKACCTVCSDDSDGPRKKEAPWNQIMDCGLRCNPTFLEAGR